MYKTQGKKGLFDEEFTKEHLSKMGNPLAAISKVIDFELFSGIIRKQITQYQ